MTEQSAQGQRTTNAETVDEFNAAYPVGTQVLAFPGSRDGRAILTRTRSTAWRIADRGEPVVMVEDYAGGIALTHIEVMPVAELEAGLLMQYQTFPDSLPPTVRARVEAALARADSAAGGRS